jgi:aspartate/methionine/tyrosine aminotransferase
MLTGRRCIHLEDIEWNVLLIDSVLKHHFECGIRIGVLIIKTKLFSIRSESSKISLYLIQA